MVQFAVLDTNFLYSMYVKDDIHHQDSLQLLMDLPEEINFIIPEIVVLELIAAGETIDFIERSKVFSKKPEPVTSQDIHYIQTLPPQLRRKLKANDCIILAITKRFKAKLLTFDKTLSKTHEDIRN